MVVGSLPRAVPCELLDQQKLTEIVVTSNLCRKDDVGEQTVDLDRKVCLRISPNFLDINLLAEALQFWRLVH